MSKKRSEVMSDKQRARYERVLRDIEMDSVRDAAKNWKENRIILVQLLKTFNWCCPRWQNSKLYPSQESELADWQWRWEFLRRLPLYRITFLLSLETENNTDFGSYKYDLEDFIDPRLQALTLKQNPFAMLSGGESFRLPDRAYFEEEFFIERNIGLGDDSAKLKALLDYLESLKLFEDSEGGGDEFFRLKHYSPLRDQQIKIIRRIDLLQSARRNLLKLSRSDDKSDPFHPSNTLPQGVRLKGKDRDNWPRHLRVIDAKDQGATHEEIYRQFAEESAGSNDDALDDLYRTGTQPKATVSQWYSQAIEVMEKASRFL